MSSNTNLHSAKRAKQDNFYTQLADIENELKHYKSHFKDKTVYCNCDDPSVSNFFRYFLYNFTHLGLKKLISTCYKNQQRDLFSKHDCERAIWLEYGGGVRPVPDPEDIGIRTFRGNGDFRSEESIELLKQADIVVTNPPFSLFREYVAQLVEYDKKFLIIGNKNAITYKEIFPLIKANEIWLGIGGVKEFEVTDEKNGKASFCQEREKWFQKFGNVGWFTNLEHNRRHEELPLYRRYSPEEYPKYDNYDAINVNKTKDIPMDWGGAMGVPVTFLDKYNPEQFEIIGADYEFVKKDRFYVQGKRLYSRTLIRNNRPQ